MTLPVYQYLVTISSRFPRNSEADASEFLGNLEEMFTRYYTHREVYVYKFIKLTMFLISWIVHDV